MVRSYEVEAYLSEMYVGFILLCYEGDELVYHQYFDDSDDAVSIGEKFLDGLYVRGYSVSEMA
jgi:hypothetical protein